MFALQCMSHYVAGLYLLGFSCQDDDDGHLIVLGIAEELMVKASDIYLEQFARLGVFSKVEALAAAPASHLSPDSDGATAPGKCRNHHLH